MSGWKGIELPVGSVVNIYQKNSNGREDIKEIKNFWGDFNRLAVRSTHLRHENGRRNS